MAVILELRCLAHGPYEHHEKTCPSGCPPEFVTQEFRTPPSLKSNRTKFADAQLRGLAHDYKLPDIKNDKDGTSVMDSIRKGEDFAPKFIDIPHPEPGWTQRGEKAKAVSPSPYLMGKKGENVLGQVAPRLPPPRPAFVNPPNPEPGAFR